MKQSKEILTIVNLTKSEFLKITENTRWRRTPKKLGKKLSTSNTKCYKNSAWLVSRQVKRMIVHFMSFHMFFQWGNWIWQKNTHSIHCILYQLKCTFDKPWESKGASIKTVVIQRLRQSKDRNEKKKKRELKRQKPLIMISKTSKSIFIQCDWRSVYNSINLVFAKLSNFFSR